MAELTGDLVDIFPAYEDGGVLPPNWDGDEVTLTLEKEAVSPPDWPSFLPHPAPPLAGLYTAYYLMRGWRPSHVPVPAYETWVAAGVPNALNPSGEPIQDISVQIAWYEINV